VEGIRDEVVQPIGDGFLFGFSYPCELLNDRPSRFDLDPHIQLERHSGLLWYPPDNRALGLGGAAWEGNPFTLRNSIDAMILKQIKDGCIYPRHRRFVFYAWFCFGTSRNANTNPEQ
jgi:hypothetical protein